MQPKHCVIVGYSGHGYVSLDILQLMGYTVIGYCDVEEKNYNPFQLAYLGTEVEYFSRVDEMTICRKVFISIGDNRRRKKVFEKLTALNCEIINAIHPLSIVSSSVKLGKGVLIAANATINPLCTIGDGVICNTSSSIDHNCRLGDFSHICPGSVICGDVEVGKSTFIGANSVVRQGIKIGENILIGSGSVVVRDLEHGKRYFGNPAILK
jgi:sugar O-acyltransferase (sialic acid O-acetyltransferase NeuD family)